MKSATTGTVSGCIVWVIAAVLIGSCLLPLGYFVSSFTDQSDLAIRTVSPFICPKGTTGQSYTYDTTMPDDNGFQTPAVGFELHCVDANENVVKTDPLLFRFIWEGLEAGISLLAVVALAFLLAAPVGALVGRLFRSKQATAIQ